MAEIPNFDGEHSADDLMALWAWLRHASRRECAKIVGDKRPGYSRIVNSDLANYASNAATARRLRDAGNIEMALSYEAICDKIYDGIPRDLRW